MWRAVALLSGLVLLAAGCSEERAAGTTPPAREQTPSAAAMPPRPVPAQPPQEVPGAPLPEALARATAPKAALEPPETDWSGGDAGRGHAVFTQYCTLCHGGGGRGDGPAAAALNPKPRDFTTGVFYLDANANAKTGEDIDLARVIREGPAAFGGSPAMTPWKETLSEQQVRDLVAFVQSLAAQRPHARAAQPPRSTSPGSAPVWTPSSSSTWPLTAHSA